ncbi:hypothetical protein ACQP2T_45280 [Nonomuraea sp. CA-143628]|uniref:hypothetical protein n=1 Tax=Nonomuraea sp. CA-143628 TaxID=3239997 RepID=UPI003D8DA811
MNEEAETRDAKLRAAAVEATARSRNGAYRGPRARRQHASLPTNGCPCLEGIHAAIASTAVAVERIRVEIASIKAETSQDFAALGDEIAGLRRHTKEQLTSAQRQMLDRLDCLQRTMADVERTLHRLLDKDGA